MMGGILDIKNAFAKSAPGIDLRAVRMSYDHQRQKQVLEFDVVENGVMRTMKEELEMGAGMRPMLDAAMKVARALGATITEIPEVPPVPTSEMAKAAGIAKLAEVEASAPQIVHEGETYELAVDGKPKSLFF